MFEKDGAAVLLDRDGTINVDTGYVCDPRSVRLEDGAIAGLKRLVSAGWKLIVLSNQSGVGRSFFGLSDVVEVNRAIAAQLSIHGIEIAGWYVCPHAPADHCNCLALRAAKDFALDLHKCWVIGDKRSDLQLADAVSAPSILLMTGEGIKHADWAKATGKPICETLADAAELILSAQPAILPPRTQERRW